MTGRMHQVQSLGCPRHMIGARPRRGDSVQGRLLVATRDQTISRSSAALRAENPRLSDETDAASSHAGLIIHTAAEA